MRRSQGDEQLMAFVLGELSAAEAAEVEARLLVDEDAAAEVESMRAMAGMLDGAFVNEALPELGEARRNRVLSGPEPMRMRWGWRVRAAAALLIGLTGVVVTKEILLRSGGERDSSARMAGGTARPAAKAPLRETVARDDGNVPFRFMGETSP